MLTVTRARRAEVYLFRCGFLASSTLSQVELYCRL
jgi:hypothetical protein